MRINVMNTKHSNDLPTAGTAISGRETTQDRRGAFTLVELLVTIAIIAVLAALLLMGVSYAKTRALTIQCKNNLHQVSLAMTMYCGDNHHYPGSWWIHQTVGVDHYVWPERLLTQAANNRKVFSCPAARPDSVWDPAVNKTLGCYSIDGQYDPYAIHMRSRFAIAYNDWGLMQDRLNDPAYPQLGMGGDVTGPFFKGFLTENAIQSPSQMIMFGDSSDDAMWDASMKPNRQPQWPSNRHARRTNLEFVDGHIETPKRKEVIDPAPDNPWRNRWNNDNLPHNDLTWDVDWAREAVVQP